MNSSTQSPYPTISITVNNVNAPRQNTTFFPSYVALPFDQSSFTENAQPMSVAMNTHTEQPQSQVGHMQQQHQPHTNLQQQHQQQHHPPTQQKFLQNALHSSVVDKLDPTFVKLYNNYMANGPAPSNDINVVRSNFSSLYSYATAAATGVGGIGETTVPGWEKYPGEINIRVYVPPGEESGKRKVWPVHFNFHGGGKRVSQFSGKMTKTDISRLGMWRSRDERSYVPSYLRHCAVLCHRRLLSTDP